MPNKRKNLSSCCKIPKTMTSIQRKDMDCYEIEFHDPENKDQIHNLTFIRRIHFDFSISIDLWLDSLKFHSEKIDLGKIKAAVAFWEEIGKVEFKWRNEKVESIRKFGMKYYKIEET